ncbi:pyridoxamine 5'-phosphate oxidase family protein [Hydrogenophaga defluvii]|uniref:Pyridoxamine 5'-phosphate oxidase family protein n=1 Tax=Hydrogenophaga defluvii TaxID=249410 RepID=A0ABW2S7G2_9BURK
MFNDEIRDCVRRSVLCWLATADTNGQPNVSPKEVFALVGDNRLVIAHIASPRSVANIRQQPLVCVSCIDVFEQRGVKLVGNARVVVPTEADFAALAEPLLAQTQDVFPIRAVIEVCVIRVEPIVAPSYRMVPGTTRASQEASALRAYGVVRASPGRESR